MKQISISIFCIILLVSCSKKVSEMYNQSPNKQTNITIRAIKEAMGEPWKVNLKVEVATFKDSIGIEIYNSIINDESVKFNWVSDSECNIIFEQTDGVSRQFHLIATTFNYSLEEVK